MNPLDQELQQALSQLRCLEELATDQQDDDAFMARGNGFCDRKYSDDFLQMRIAQLTARVAELQRRLPSDAPETPHP